MRRVRVCVVVVWGLWLLLVTTQRVPLWTDEYQLWQEATVQSPWKPRVWINFGNAAADRGEVHVAEMAYQQAIACASDPSRGLDEYVLGTAIASANLAILRWEAGEIAEAHRLLRVARVTAPHVVPIHDVSQWMHITPR